MALPIKVLVCLVTWLTLYLTVPPAWACTLFAAAGRSVKGGGVLIAKNRDRSPLINGLKVFAPPKGYRHLGLVTMDAPDAPAVAGINEKGLVVVDASPSSLPLTEEEHSAVPLTQALLSRCASVQEVLAQKELFQASYPVFEMAADRQQVALIQVAPGGQVDIQVIKQGTLCHTNHYQSAPLLWANRLPHPSSQVRLARITELLERQGRPLTFADFLVFSQDRHTGPDNSINRLGSTPAKTRTVATFVAQLSNDSPQIFVRMSNPGEPDKMVNFRLDPGLWDKGLREKIDKMTMTGGPGLCPLD